MSLKSPKRMNTDKMTRQSPTLTLIVPPEGNYGVMLQQTKMVYDQLLADKHSKLYQGLMQRKGEYDAKCTELFAQDKGKAMEFGVRAQEALNNLCREFSDELTVLRRDYQQKLNKMYSQLDDKWKEDQSKATEQAAPCQVYPRK